MAHDYYRRAKSNKLVLLLLLLFHSSSTLLLVSFPMSFFLLLFPNVTYVRPNGRRPPGGVLGSVDDERKKDSERGAHEVGIQTHARSQRERHVARHPHQEGSHQRGRRSRCDYILPQDVQALLVACPASPPRSPACMLGPTPSSSSALPPLPACLQPPFFLAQFLPFEAVHGEMRGETPSLSRPAGNPPSTSSSESSHKH